ncbi:hypothetical protein V2J09_010793 [Rumex salicifolius]
MSSTTPALSWDILDRIFSVKSPASPSSTNGVVSSDVSIDTTRNLWFRLYVPSSAAGNTASLPVVVYFHGGGFNVWSPDCKPYDDLCRTLAAESEAVVVSVNYRLTPEHRFPAQYDDGVKTLRFLDRHAPRSIPGNADLGKCIIAGDSAGGNIAHHVAVRATECQDSFKAVKVVGLITIQPFFTANQRSESEIRLEPDPVLKLQRTDHFWTLFLPEGSDRDHPAASVFGPNGEDISGLGGFPSSLIFVGGSDPLHDWGCKYYEWLIGSGKKAKLVHYPNAPHCFYSTDQMPDYSAFVHEIKGFVRTLAA